MHGLLGLVENMSGGDAYKPGDILDTYSGKTIEVMNTDAEGRLVLCDLLAFAAERLAPSRIVDLATLTGACVVALGTHASGVFTRDDALREHRARGGGRGPARSCGACRCTRSTCRRCRRVRPTCATPAGAGAERSPPRCSSASSCPRTLPWVHLDIAGPAFAEHDLPEARAGGTGAGVLTLLRWLESL